MPGVFVTATGTGVGKTFVTAGLIAAARRMGRPVDALKPVLSGYVDAEAAVSDAGVLLTTLGRPVTPETVAVLSPWRFSAPLSPDMAAAAESRAIVFDVVVAACRTAVRGEALTLIEGVGGVMVPLDRRHTILDLVAALALPVVLVSATHLGAISHALTARAALESRGCGPALIVLNESEGSTVPLHATLETLTAFCRGTKLAIVPRGGGERVFDELLRHLTPV